MNIASTAKKSSSVSLVIFLFFICMQHTVWGQQVEIKGYDKASYNVSQAGRFMQTWLVTGPVAVSNDTTAPADKLQEEVFKAEDISQVKIIPGHPISTLHVNQRDLVWKLVSQGSDIIDLDSVFQRKDFVYAYALAEIKSPAAARVMLAVGSDDGIRVWHNGKLVHDNWIPRSVEKDNDLVPLKLVKGSNQLLLKIQDMQGGWGFSARLLDKAGLTEQLNTAAAAGNLDKVKMLIDGGADINGRTKTGVAPVISAKISGRKEVVAYLLKLGAKDQAVPAAESITDNYYHSIKGKDYPGIALLVARDGNILYRKGFGYAVIKEKIPVTPGTKFRIGSVTKQFTAAAILKLQEKNLLSVQDKLSKYIPDFPRGDEVTIHHLLTHTSGIRSYTGKPEFLDKVTKTISPDSLIAWFKNDKYDFNPGERLLYNNSGYFLLGYIIAQVSGKPYDVYLRETFFDPLGMTHTGVYYTGIKLDQEAKGYAKKADHYEEALNWDMSWAGAAGAMYSTLDDLLKWNQALHNGKVLNEKSLQAALTPVVLKSGEEPAMKYGYGLGMNKYRGVDFIGHSGGLHGFLTHLAYYPKEKLSVVMFTNTSDPDFNFDPNKIAEAFLWNRMDTQSSYAQTAVKPQNLHLLTGRYELANIGVMMITTTGDRLYAQLTGQPKFEIFPSSEYEFFWKVVDARIRFLKNDKGEINQAILFQGGREMKAERLPEEKIVDIDPAILDQYTGKYRLNETIVVTIYKEKNKLIAHPTDQPKLEMLPTSETEFVIRELNAKLRFEKGEDGKVTKIKLHMNNTDSELPKIE